ncbi:phage tail assembly chaperone family protein, TAC [Shewanella inventionis]|uniref:phage tail assembly chaperone family protein, TAC n=1 Tax=Shewanella inventionis TaxID=1738770 RepID=UPI001CBB92F6|nr:phage tail assembly chaperone family protein, TAC [Shewanella inventionis]UAL42119.1 phage tail assembly chaperone family protein, TAC [Shewanella inventionis]
MQLSVASLIQSGSYSPAKPEQREITWLNDKGESVSANVYVRKKSFATANLEAKHFHAGIDSITSRIVSSIVDENGTPLFEVDDITGNDAHGPICDSLGMALWGAINEVNGFGLTPDPKSLPPTTTSGTSLSSQASVEEPSNMPSKT